MPTNDKKTLDEHSLRYLTRSGVRYVTRDRHARLKDVEMQLVAGMAPAQIAADLSTKHGVRPATIHDDVELLWENWAARDVQSRPIMRQQVTEMFLAVYRMAVSRKDSQGRPAPHLTAANQAALGIARVHGLLTPDQHAHLHLYQTDDTSTNPDDIEADLESLAQRLSYKRARLERAKQRVDTIDVESAG